MGKLKRNKITLKIGDRFNKWTIISDIFKIVNTQKYYLCRCICGYEKYVSQYNLKQNRSRSCIKCATKNSGYNRRLSNNQGSINGIFRSYKKSAKYRKIYFNLTKEEVSKLIQQPCFYCGCLKSNTRKIYQVIFKYNGIDRIDNNKGYTADNCVTCCFICNDKKKAMSKQDFLSWIEKVYNYSIKNG